MTLSNFRNRTRAALVGGLALAALPGLALAGGEAILTDAVPAVSGPKRTVAVGEFDAVGAFTATYGSWDVGGGLSAMLTSALVESNRFIEVERARLQQILTEQELKGNGITSGSATPNLGQMTGVQLLVYGSITEFGTADKGGGFSIGVSGGGLGGLGGLLSGALSPRRAEGVVAMDFRVVDTTTGRVLETHRVREMIESNGFDVSVGYRGISLGSNQFYNTPLGQATRRAITRAVQLLARDADKAGWTGQVVDFERNEIYINAGSATGVKSGDTFMVERVVKRLTDPATNEVLLLKKKRLGIVEVGEVGEKIAIGTFKPLDTDAPARGDLVVALAK